MTVVFDFCMLQKVMWHIHVRNAYTNLMRVKFHKNFRLKKKTKSYQRIALVCLRFWFCWSVEKNLKIKKFIKNGENCIHPIGISSKCLVTQISTINELLEFSLHGIGCVWIESRFCSVFSLNNWLKMSKNKQIVSKFPSKYTIFFHKFYAINQFISDNFHKTNVVVC